MGSDFILGFNHSPLLRHRMCNEGGSEWGVILSVLPLLRPILSNDNRIGRRVLIS